jgi:hypothetical protein
VTALPILGGGNGAAFGINNRGQVAGEAEKDVADPTCVSPQVRQYKPVIWDREGAHELPTFPVTRTEPLSQSMTASKPSDGQALARQGMGRTKRSFMRYFGKTVR